jgi:hypothetical protein
MRVAVVVGSARSETTAGSRELPASDRGALALALKRFGRDVRAYACDLDARAYARAAGVERVAAGAELEPDAFDVALIGRGGCGVAGDARPARLAEASGAALVYAVIDVQSEADRLLVTRDLGRGARDVLDVRGRAVLVVADSVARGRYVSRYRIHAERAGASAARDASSGASRENWEGLENREPLENEEREESWKSWQLTTPRVRLGDHAARVAGSAVERMNALFGVGEVGGVGGTAGRSGTLVRASAKQCALELIRDLARHGFLERGPVADAQRAPDATSGAPASEQPLEREPRTTQPAAARPVDGYRPEPGAAAPALPARVGRRPRRADGRSRATRGPFEIGVDR